LVAPRAIAQAVVPSPGPDDPIGVVAADQYSWRYATNVGEPTAMVHQVAARWVPAPRTGSLIDLTTGFVEKMAGPGADAHGDWRSELERGLAGGFDLPQRLIDVLRSLVESGDSGVLGPSNSLSLSVFHAVVVALRDTANSGLLPGPDGHSLAELVVQALLRAADRQGLDKARIEAQCQTIVDQLRDYELTHPDDSGWKTTLRSALDGLRMLPSPSPLDDVDTAFATLPADRQLSVLEELQGTLAREDVLRELLLAQWDQALGGAQDWEYVRFALKTTVLPMFPLRPRYLQGAIGGPGRAIWELLVTFLPGTGEEWEKLRQNFESTLLAYVFGRLDLSADASAGHWGAWKPRVSTVDLVGLRAVQGSLEAETRALGKLLAERIIPAVSEHPATTTTRVPHPLVFQVDRLDSSATETSLRSVSGAGLLIRKAGGTWRCANIASIVDVAGGSNPDVATANLLVPATLAHGNGLLQAFLSYDGHPLVAETPLYPTDSDVVLEDTQSDIGERPFRYTAYPPASPVAVPLDPWGRLPRLRFGDDYEAIVFVVGNHGTLPPLLCTPDSPLDRVAPEEFGASWDLQSAAFKDRYVRKVEYRRRVPIAPPRFCSPADDFVKSMDVNAALPLIPDGVVPLAGDLGLTRQQNSDPSKGKDEVPLLLLWPQMPNGATNQFEFALRSPTVDVSTWDRWVGGRANDPDSYPNLSKCLLADVNREGSSRSSSTIRDTDLTIDDPAVSGWKVSVITHFPTGHARQEATIALEDLGADLPPALAPGQSWSKVQRERHRFVCKRTDSGLPTLDQRPGTRVIEVAVPRGFVVELQVTSCAKTGDVRKFEAGPFVWGAPHAGLVGASDAIFRLLIESATSEMPTEEELWHAMSLPAADDGRLRVQLDSTRVPARRGYVFTFVKRVEVARQGWRWLGRPVDSFPLGNLVGDAIDEAPSGLHPEDYVRFWEVKGFADRPDVDATVVTASATILDGRRICTLFEEDRSSDPRAQLYRIGLRAFSRYHGLVDARVVKAVHRDGGSCFTNWRRRYLPCRWPNSPVPKPRIKLILPLTRWAQGAEAPSCLVVLNEQFFQLGGITESLKAEVMMAPDPMTEDPAVPGLLGPRAEIGPDPIFTASIFPLAVNERIPMQNGGAIGTTFDADSDTPLFANTVVRFQLPTASAGGTQLVQRDAPPVFAKICFRRVLKQGVESEATEAHWVQFLPDSASFCFKEPSEHGRGRNDYVPLEHIGFDLSADTIVFYRMAKGVTVGTSLVPLPLRAEPPMVLELWAAVTTVITDVTGREDEAFVGLFRLDGEFIHALVPLPPDNPLVAEGRMRLRLLEVQSHADHPAPPDPAKWWEGLFPVPTMGTRTDPQDASLRILRVSPPIRSTRTPSA